MPLETPDWWYGPPTATNTLITAALSPAAAIYNAATTRRFAKTAGIVAHVPVICVGNLTAGGTGKTPLARTIARLARESGMTPAFLTRGYKGSQAGPLWVDATSHTADEVGDEPLLLAQDGPTLVSRNRADGVRNIADTRPDIDLIVMDDGLQNPLLKKDLSIAVIDGRRGLGNAKVIPAGPLRATLTFHAPRVDLIVVNTPDAMTEAIKSQVENAFNPPKPQLTTNVVPRPMAACVHTKPALAYAGIGNPNAFFDTLQSCGIQIADTISFPDHHMLTDNQAHELLTRAAAANANLVTTEKDWVRLNQRLESHAELATKSHVLMVDAVFATGDEARMTQAIIGVKRSA